MKWEIYTKKIQIEARVLGDLAVNHVIPIATRYQSLLLDNVYKIKAVYPPKRAKELASMDAALIEEIAGHVSAIKRNVDAMIEARKVANKITGEYAKAVAYHDKGVAVFRRDPLPRRQAGTDCRRRDVVVAEIPRVALYPVSPTAVCHNGRTASLLAECKLGHIR